MLMSALLSGCHTSDVIVCYINFHLLYFHRKINHGFTVSILNHEPSLSISAQRAHISSGKTALHHDNIRTNQFDITFGLQNKWYLIFIKMLTALTDSFNMHCSHIVAALFNQCLSISHDLQLCLRCRADAGLCNDIVIFHSFYPPCHCIILRKV